VAVGDRVTLPFVDAEIASNFVSLDLINPVGSIAENFVGLSSNPLHTDLASGA
jgi:hypothetical protein